MFTRTIRATGEKLTVARPEEVNADPEGGNWVTLCEDHKTIAYAATQSAAYYTHGAGFCDGCRAAQQSTAKASVKKPSDATVHEATPNAVNGCTCGKRFKSKSALSRHFGTADKASA
ncbi:hypothetical protein [Microbacterium sp. NPDC096154]|uniref:hypothetical protein n=1 Tax=Microbacterium sp. NPDC096154 TaxID=3155549 RepID=UPI00331D0355